MPKRNAWACMETIERQAPRQLSFFSDRLPHRPYCTDDLGCGLRVLPLQVAMEKKYIQYNQPAIINWLVFDIDRPYSPDAEWAIIAPPNIIARNPANGHAHLFYGIAAGVCKTSAARHAPLKLLSAINESYRHALGADTGFTELICKNPLNAFWGSAPKPAEFVHRGDGKHLFVAAFICCHFSAKLRHKNVHEKHRRNACSYGNRARQVFRHTDF